MAEKYLICLNWRRLLINSYVIVNFTGEDCAAIGED